MLDKRANHIRLAPGAQLLVQYAIGLLAPICTSHDACDDRLALARQLAQHAAIEVAVARERERPRDRRSGHVQHMWAPGMPFLAFQRRTLAHTETVLLVDDGHRQLAKAHRWLDQGVRAYDQRQLAA